MIRAVEREFSSFPSEIRNVRTVRMLRKIFSPDGHFAQYLVDNLLTSGVPGPILLSFLFLSSNCSEPCARSRRERGSTTPLGSSYHPHWPVDSDNRWFPSIFHPRNPQTLGIALSVAPACANFEARASPGEEKWRTNTSRYAHCRSRRCCHGGCKDRVENSRRGAEGFGACPIAPS